MHSKELAMALTKYKLGPLIELQDVRNTEGKYTVDDVRGISTEKDFIETKANLDGVSLDSYKIVQSNEFAYVADTSRRGDKIALAFNTQGEILISSIYTVFRVKRTDLLLSDFLFIYFNRPEFDRYARFNSWGSARETFNWEDMCDIELELPSPEIQQKYVNIYKTMVENQKSYERGLDDLKLVCDAYIEDLRQVKYNKIKDYICKNTTRNQNKTYDKSDVKGFNNEGQFIEPMRLFSGDISTFKIIKPDDFVYNPRINSSIKKLSIALNEGKELIVSPAYESFYINKSHELNSAYLYMLLQREQFAKKVLFNSFGSSTLVFSLDDLGQVEIPVPNIEIQENIIKVYKAYQHRKSIKEKLKEQIKNICPILIKGSIEEAKKEA